MEADDITTADEVALVLARHLNDARREMRADRVHDNEVHRLVTTDYRPAVWKEAERRTRLEVGVDAWSAYRNTVSRQARRVRGFEAHAARSA